MSGHVEGVGFEGGDFEPEATLWVRGVDYVAGYRDASVAGAELAEALEAVGMDTSDVTVCAHAGPDGSGLVRVALSPTAVRQVAALVRAAAKAN
ncbi:hypothetical protein AB0I10_00320 [Streptomyces sp. NPDC050636]|uniref:hypothetical protein n=1 Tax=Streptomyces sp. NPDC050636 TaxID=3154510 RepID=UPI003446CA57